MAHLQHIQTDQYYIGSINECQELAAILMEDLAVEFKNKSGFKINKTQRVVLQCTRATTNPRSRHWIDELVGRRDAYFDEQLISEAIQDLIQFSQELQAKQHNLASYNWELLTSTRQPYAYLY